MSEQLRSVITGETTEIVSAEAYQAIRQATADEIAAKCERAANGLDPYDGRFIIAAFNEAADIARRVGGGGGGGQ